MTAATDQPALAITAGRPTAEEIAAIVAVLFARTGSAGAAEPRPLMRSQWASKARLQRIPLQRGQNGWRASGLPR
jgi:hypothetical protein